MVQFNCSVKMNKTLMRLSTGSLVTATAVFSILSLVIFNKIYTTSKIVVDEEFHLPLGEAYCLHDFSRWDPKVTTFPGLYLLSSLLLSSLNLCTTYWLRFTCFLSSIINVVLFYMVLRLFNKEIAWKNIITAINLSILPPLYFFSHVYYTDVPSIMMTLLLLINAKMECHYTASIFGFLTILMRQTNVVWIGMLFGDYILKELYSLTMKNKPSRKINVPLKGIQDLVKKFLTEPFSVFKNINLQFILDSSAYFTVLSSFLVFVYLNGSIVVGDKSAHQATVHLPQIFYFVTFTLIFGWPHFIGRIVPFIKFAWRNKLLMLISIILCTLIVHYNTLVHPYMLADNRHYTFYVWNRFYGRYHIFRYAMVLVYIFAIYGMITKVVRNDDIAFSFLYIFCTITVLIMQKLMEVRYYLFPYILFRIQIRKTSTTVLVLENLTYLAVNALTLYVFFNKLIIWDTYDYPQRLMW